MIIGINATNRKMFYKMRFMAVKIRMSASIGDYNIPTAGLIDYKFKCYIEL